MTGDGVEFRFAQLACAAESIEELFTQGDGLFDFMVATDDPAVDLERGLKDAHGGDVRAGQLVGETVGVGRRSSENHLRGKIFVCLTRCLIPAS